MNLWFVRLVCRILVVCMIGLPFQAHAGLIGTDQAISAAQVQVARDTVQSFVARAEVASQLQAFGLTPQAAKDRVAALTDSEIATLSGQIDSLPAGGGPTTLVWILLFIIFYWFVIRQ